MQLLIIKESILRQQKYYFFGWASETIVFLSLFAGKIVPLQPQSKSHKIHNYNEKNRLTKYFIAVAEKNSIMSTRGAEMASFFTIFV